MTQQKRALYLIEKNCPICEYGNIGFVRTAGERKVVLVCDECGATWLDPKNINAEGADAPQAPDFKIYGTESYLGKGSAWAALEEIDALGFGGFVVNEYQR